MAKKNKDKRITFSKIEKVLDMPDLLDLQLKSFEIFLQKGVKREKKKNIGLHQVFNNTFPIIDNRERYLLEYVDYYVGQPKYKVKDCQEIGATYSAPLKIKLRLSSKTNEEQEEYDQTQESDVYFGTLPIMTDKGTFIINGSERVIVTQLHRSPGVFFSSRVHTNQTTLYSAKIIPFRGSWLEFETTINDSFQVYIDRRKKFHVTTFLRAFGFSSDQEIFDIFQLDEIVKLSKKNASQLVGRNLYEEIDLSKRTADQYEGEQVKTIIYPVGTELTEEKIDVLIENKVKTLRLIKADCRLKFNIIFNTIQKDETSSSDDALLFIYEQLRLTESPDLETAKKHFERLFLDEKRYDLGDVGRYRINQKMDLKVDNIINHLRIDPNQEREIKIGVTDLEGNYETMKINSILNILDNGSENEQKELIAMLEQAYIKATIITQYDIIEILKELLEIKNGKKITDDIDHLGNRRVKTVGEQLANQFGVALSRMARTIREKMTLAKPEDPLVISDMINIKTLGSVINSFFGTNQLSQFMDQVNPLAEITHKRRLSALGVGGLTRDRAGFEVRDVHYTHYGRLCPIETPEGPNIGLISSLATYARVNDMGFIETPYRKVIKGRVTDEIVYLTADEEDRATIAQANAIIDDKGNFKNQLINVRRRGDFELESPDRIDFMDVTPTQMVSAAAALIPFLDHDDANRALMGSNMQRQAVPLMRTDAPLVATGMEERIARDSRALVTAKCDGIVQKIDATRCYIVPEDSDDSSDAVEHTFIKFFRTNNDTCINNIPLVKVGDRVKKGDVLADGAATSGGELALGKNVLVAYMSWNGYNFEDAIILSERMVTEDVFTSIHIKEYDINVKETKRGEEELTREIPNVSEEATKDLDDKGVIRIGAEVRAGDIIVGKVTPKGEVNLTPEDKLLKAIFGEKAGEVKDASLRVPPGDKGIVIGTNIFSRKKKGALTKEKDKQKQKDMKEDFDLQVNNIRKKRAKELFKVLEEVKITNDVCELKEGKNSVIIKAGTIPKLKDLEKLGFDIMNNQGNWTDVETINDRIAEVLTESSMLYDQVNVDFQRERQKMVYGDELPPGIIQMVKVYVSKKRKIQIGDKMAGRHGNKGIVSRIVPLEDLPYLEDGSPVDIILNPLGVPSRMNPGQIFETNLGWAASKLGVKFATPVFDGASLKDVKNKLKEAGLPESGKAVLHDGLTGEKFDQEVTVGYTYMLKLSHLVEDKLHARDIGPYSLITQQPLGGKAQFGGQRFGEMEVWALEAYGAAYLLQEMLTYKSDDVNGRTKVYEAIVKGKAIPKPGIPESFNVLLKELQGLGLDVKLD
ncbi:MAG: DNA-directed RNA polymerase subunit beta [Candidatus Delongbacteria bacterium]|nr:DNA-directed RNA polymerase subunit beta [Candidatus Delongbacteria bacterium]MBN2835384.1 DNA-directed RNA polymerase subunit beta [Candidatus Delongbacteria bacterium]